MAYTFRNWEQGRCVPKRDLRQRYNFKQVLDRELRRYHGRQSEVARKADVKQPSLRYWADSNTTALPTVEQAYDIAKALGVPLEYLITGEGDPEPTEEATLSRQERRLLAAFRNASPGDRALILGTAERLSTSHHEEADKQERAG